MKYFIDTEFIEGFWNAVFYKKRHFIDLISIGIVAEDGREYYAVSNEFNPKDANEWVKENVLKPIELQFYREENTYAKTYHSESLTLKNFLKWKGKSNKQIKQEIIRLFGGLDLNGNKHTKIPEDDKIEIYGYYSDYDWVLFCSLFGRMIDLPKGFPMMCFDIQQLIIDRNIDKELLLSSVPQDDLHNALSDAMWNKKAYEWIENKSR